MKNAGVSGRIVLCFKQNEFWICFTSEAQWEQTIVSDNETRDNIIWLVNPDPLNLGPNKLLVYLVEGGFKGGTKKMLRKDNLALFGNLQTGGIEQLFSVSQGVPIVDDCRIFSMIIFIALNVQRWRDVPAAYLLGIK